MSQASSARSSVGASSFNSTPPTSVDELNTDQDASKDARSASRRRTSLSTLKDSESAANSPESRKSSRSKATMKDTNSRAVSGATLVEGKEVAGKLNKVKKELELECFFDVPKLPEDDDEGNTRRRSHRHDPKPKPVSVEERLAAIGYNATWSCGKLITAQTTRSSAPTEPSNKRQRVEPKSLSGRLFPNLHLPSVKKEAKPIKKEVEKAKEAPKPKPPKYAIKKYQDLGIFAGQTIPGSEGSERSKRDAKASTKKEQEWHLPLPMFGAYTRLTVDEKVHWDDYKLPFDLLNPLPKEQVPQLWRKLEKNKLVGDAKATWSLKAHKHLEYAFCDCRRLGKEECGSDCINRHMSEECTEKNCSLGEECKNRAFAELKWRSQNKNSSRPLPDDKLKPKPNLYGEGVETFLTKDNRGYGVRAMRSFEPRQIIVEYIGEIITQDESDRRMNVDYKEKSDYYMMNFQDNLIIDATKGSICRFVNHSCSPNCRVEKWYVGGEPRMALFAGEDGILTGQELTYDYNFELFNENSKQICRCGADNCRGVLGPRPKDRPTKASKVVTGVKNAIKGVKRKMNQVLGKDEDEDPSPKRRRSKVDPKSIMAKAKKHVRDEVGSLSDDDMQLQKELQEQRAQRVRKRNREEAEHTEDDEVEVRPKSKKGRRSSATTTTTLVVSDLTRVSPRKSRNSTALVPTAVSPRPIQSPAKKMKGMKERIIEKSEALLQAAKTATRTGASSSKVAETPASRTTSQSKLVPSSSASSAGPKSMRQAKISFGTGNMAFKVSPKKRAAPEDDEDGDEEVRGPQIPKRSSSLNKAAKSRPSTSQSFANGAKKIATAARMSLGGEKAVRKTIRAVSGAE